MNGEKKKLRKIGRENFSSAYIGARNLIDDAVSRDKGHKIFLSNLTEEELIELSAHIKREKQLINRELKARAKAERAEERAQYNKGHAEEIKKERWGIILFVGAIALAMMIRGYALQIKENDENLLSHSNEITARYFAEDEKQQEESGIDFSEVGENVADFFKGLGGKRG